MKKIELRNTMIVIRPITLPVVSTCWPSLRETPIIAASKAASARSVLP
ncbi:MAG: hypothetical protein CALGDGBN_00215 [Pseudomonadales bacterium]|nr:hypothetical protein [Pseudomonadales bacterium]